MLRLDQDRGGAESNTAVCRVAIIPAAKEKLTQKEALQWGGEVLK